jgi:hypothetical protein
VHSALVNKNNVVTAKSIAVGLAKMSFFMKVMKLFVECPNMRMKKITALVNPSSPVILYGLRINDPMKDVSL